jgi:hypothetical protein
VQIPRTGGWVEYYVSIHMRYKRRSPLSYWLLFLKSMKR